MCLRISYRFIEIFLGSVQVVFHNSFSYFAFFVFPPFVVSYFYPLFFYSCRYWFFRLFVPLCDLDQVDLFSSHDPVSPPSSSSLRQSGSKDEVFLFFFFINFFCFFFFFFLIRSLLLHDSIIRRVDTILGIGVWLICADAFKWTRPVRPSLSRFCPISSVLIRR